MKSSRKYGSFGNYIEIDHGNGYVTVYGHLSKRNVKKGEKVVRGEKVPGKKFVDMIIEKFQASFNTANAL